jgi:hypothetical protein
MHGQWIVTCSLIAGLCCGARTWYSWSGEGPSGIGETLMFCFSLQFLEAMFESHAHKLIVLNAGCCLLYLFGKLLQETFLGTLREMEAIKVGDRARTYALGKMIFMGAILHDHDEKEMMVWFTWLTLVGFVKHMGLLVRDRLEYVTLAINTMDLPKIGILLSIVVALNTYLVFVCVRVFGCRLDECDAGAVSVMLLLLFECLLTYIDALQTFLRVALYVINLKREVHSERRRLYAFYSELTCQLMVHTLSLLHYIHVWAVHGLSFSLLDFLLLLHTRTIVSKIRAKLTSLSIFLTIDKRLPDATAEQLATAQDAKDACAICREDLSSAKVLPCGHLFHLVCLRDWLDQSATCPICRRPVPSTASVQEGSAVNGEGGGMEGTVDRAEMVGGHAGGDRPGDGQGEIGVGEIGVGDLDSDTGASTAGGMGADRGGLRGLGVSHGLGGEEARMGGQGREMVRRSWRQSVYFRFLQFWGLLWDLEVRDGAVGLGAAGAEPEGFAAFGGSEWDADVMGEEMEEHERPQMQGPGMVTTEMVEQVLEILPDLDAGAVQRDLMLTGAVDVTVIRGLEGLISPVEMESSPSTLTGRNSVTSRDGVQATGTENREEAHSESREEAHAESRAGSTVKTHRISVASGATEETDAPRKFVRAKRTLPKRTVQEKAEEQGQSSLSPTNAERGEMAGADNDTREVWTEGGDSHLSSEERDPCCSIRQRDLIAEAALRRLGGAGLGGCAGAPEGEQDGLLRKKQ